MLKVEIWTHFRFYETYTFDKTHEMFRIYLIKMPIIIYKVGLPLMTVLIVDYLLIIFTASQ